MESNIRKLRIDETQGVVGGARLAPSRPTDALVNRPVSHRPGSPGTRPFDPSEFSTLLAKRL
jgi:hypothetical protein